MKGIKSYSLHRETKKPKKRNCFFIYKLRQQIQADLIDVSALEKANSGYKFLFTAIDMFSKKLVCFPMKNKTGQETCKVLKRLIKDMKPKQLFTDSGKEFCNHQVQQFLEAENIKHVTASSDLKCSGVERVNKTLQMKLYKYMTEMNSDSYISVLNDIVSSYNESIHTSIEMSPIDAEKKENHLNIF